MSLYQLCFQSNLGQGVHYELRYFFCRLQSGSFLGFWSGVIHATGATARGVPVLSREQLLLTTVSFPASQQLLEGTKGRSVPVELFNLSC